MPCYFPLQAVFSVRSDGKKQISFSKRNSLNFLDGVKVIGDSSLSLPCGRCMGCKLERSRQWAVRCVHESRMHKDNCFVTLTYAPEHLPSDASLSMDVIPAFMKRLRQYVIPKHLKARGMSSARKSWVKDNPIRVFYCGEYGDEGKRPHYHLCIFGYCFPDRVPLYKENGFWYYESDVLKRLWIDVESGQTLGRSVVCDFSFETAAYVARYCTKKITGDLADDHYKRVDLDTGRVFNVLPEFARMSNRPGIGKAWLDKFGKTDVFPLDECVARGHRCKPPRYYDVLREREDPEGFALVKEARRVRGESKQEDNSFKRLAVKLKCQEARFKLLVRKMEKEFL